MLVRIGMKYRPGYLCHESSIFHRQRNIRVFEGEWFVEEAVSIAKIRRKNCMNALVRAFETAVMILPRNGLGVPLMLNNVGFC